MLCGMLDHKLYILIFKLSLWVITNQLNTFNWMLNSVYKHGYLNSIFSSLPHLTSYSPTAQTSA